MMAMTTSNSMSVKADNGGAADRFFEPGADGAGGLTALVPGVIFPAMTTTVTAKGAVVLPRKVLRQQKVRAGDHFEVTADADEPGVILLRRVPNGTRTNWVDILLACPEKGWFKPMPRRKERMRKVRL
jgi:hypothetical protein